MNYSTNRITIDPTVYQHPIDKLTTQKLVNSKYFGQALDYISKNGVEPVFRGLYSSTYMHLTPQTSPEIYEMLENARQMFGCHKQFDVFLQRKYDMGTQLIGINIPTLVFSSEYLKQADETMLFGTIAGEVASACLGHCEIKTIQWVINFLTAFLPDAISIPLRTLINQWEKYAQFTFDRTTLLATGDFNKAMCQILSGLASQKTLRSIDFESPSCGYMQQCMQYMESDGKIVDILRSADTILSEDVTYPMRYMELKKFYENEYNDLIDDYCD